MRIDELTDSKFGKLTVIKRVENKNSRTMWLCLCECGEKTVVSASALKTGNTRSCGCLAKDNPKTHGASHEPWYPNWRSMIRRMTNPKDKYHEYYTQELGLELDDDLKNDPWAFYKELGEYPGKGWTVDRIDNSLGYVKGNLRWATQTEQNQNKGLYKSNVSGVSGVTFDKARNKWSSRVHYNKKTHFGGWFDHVDDAIDARNKLAKKIKG